jgi:hypothetical protein
MKWIIIGRAGSEVPSGLGVVMGAPPRPAAASLPATASSESGVVADHIGLASTRSFIRIGAWHVKRAS